MKDTNNEIELIEREDSAKQEDESTSPTKKLLRKPATRVGKILLAVLVAVVIIGGAYAVVRLNQPSITQTGPKVPVTSVSVGCTDLTATPVSVLVGDGGGDVRFYCGNGSPALTAINGTAALVVTGLATPSMPIPPGTYGPTFYLFPADYPGPFGSGQSCSGIQGAGGFDEKHFGYPITLGTGRWDYCVDYINQTSAGSLNMITVTWTPVADWP